MTGGVSTAQDDIRFSLNGITTGYYSSLIYVTHGSTTVLGASQQNQNNIQWLGGTTGANVYFDFDNDADVASAYLQPGESITFDLGSNGVDVEFLSVLSSTGTNAVRVWWAQR